MYELDKEKFGIFLAEQRRQKGFTQKDLAACLYVSDKAVSKWERGLSMPDVSLLVPLAELLDVSVTELLEARKIDAAEALPVTQVDALVKHAIGFSGEAPEALHTKKKRRAWIFAACAVLDLAGMLCVHRLGIPLTGAYESFFVFAILSLVFGAYFWLFAREQLPRYYDENEISCYTHGIFRFNIAGVSINNRNWKRMLQYLRLWSAASLLLMPLVILAAAQLIPLIGTEATWNRIVLFTFLGSLFAPCYYIGKKYE